MWRFEGAKRKAERGIKGIIGIFFFHYACRLEKDCRTNGL